MALDAYIDQYEGRPCDVLGHRSSAEAVEDLLIPRTLDTTLDRYAGVGSMDKLHFQRLSSLKRMVDEAYERLEKQGNRALRDDRQLPGRSQIDAQTFIHVHVYMYGFVTVTRTFSRTTGI